MSRFGPLAADQPPTRAAVTVIGVVVAACLGLVVLIGEDLLDGGGLISRDDTTLAWFVDHRSDTSITVARVTSTLFGFVGLAVLAIVMAAWMLRRSQPKLLALTPLASLLAAGLLAVVVKTAFGRARPPIALQATTVGLDSFPSAHATDAAAFFVAAALVLCLTTVKAPRHQVATITVGVALAGVVGVSRLVLAVHWLSDVVAGWALGTAVALSLTTGAWLLQASSTEWRKHDVAA